MFGLLGVLIEFPFSIPRHFEIRNELRLYYKIREAEVIDCDLTSHCFHDAELDTSSFFLLFFFFVSFSSSFLPLNAPWHFSCASVSSYNFPAPVSLCTRTMSIIAASCVVEILPTEALPNMSERVNIMDQTPNSISLPSLPNSAPSDPHWS